MWNSSENLLNQDDLVPLTTNCFVVLTSLSLLLLLSALLIDGDDSIWVYFCSDSSGSTASD